MVEGVYGGEFNNLMRMIFRIDATLGWSGSRRHLRQSESSAPNGGFEFGSQQWLHEWIATAAQSSGH